MVAITFSIQRLEGQILDVSGQQGDRYELAEQRTNIINRRAVSIAVLLLAVMVLSGTGRYILAPAYSAPQSLAESQIEQASTNATLAASLLAGSPPTLGSPKAAVTIVEFGDPQCPSCGQWFQTQEPAVVQNLVNTGRAALVWRDFDYFGPDSVTASEAAYAAGDQGKFWQFHDLLYQNQQTANNGWADAQNMEKFATQMGLNMTLFNQDFQSGKYVPLINSNHALGVEAGVSGTPTFFVVGSNGNIVTIAGGQPESVFAQAVTQLTSSPAPEFQSIAILPLLALLITLITLAVGKKRNSVRS